MTDMPNEILMRDGGEIVKYIRADLVPQWQPIETAPKDSSYILMYGQDVGFAVYPSPRYPSQVWGGVTHWQPLPQPPK